MAAKTHVSGQQPSQTETTRLEPLTLRATTVEELRTWDPYVTEAARSGVFRLRSTTVDPLMPSRVVERFDQFHNGVRIWGADVVRDSERGVPLSIFGELPPSLTLSTTPSLSVEESQVRFLRLAGPEAVLLRQPELVMVRLENREYRLAYTAVVSDGSLNVFRAFIDAHTGLELMREAGVHRQQAGVGTGAEFLEIKKS